MTVEVNKYPDLESYLEGEYYYSPVVDGKELHLIAETHDVALLLGLGVKYDGINTKFPQMACRMLNIESEWAK